MGKVRTFQRKVQAAAAAASEPATEKKSTEIMGLDHPEMTPTLAAFLLPDGPHIPLELLQRASELIASHPLKMTAQAINREISAQLDAQLRAAQVKPA